MYQQKNLYAVGSYGLATLNQGMGQRSLGRFSSWNTALTLRYYWLLLSNSQSLWTRWHKHHHLRESTIWALEQKPTQSWTWNALLGLKLLAASFMKFTIHNGNNTSFWFDPWTPFGSLISFIGAGGPRLLRVPLNASVSEVCEANRWRLPSP